ncbi:YegP family protein [Deinococcus oregonensis]|uniref:YegP family protein n=1 Tax=Deinococcus oregonensis TaxID=1805970 RepID=A0ABV6B3D0_9DEIO
MAGKFIVKRSGDQFMFNLHAGNSQIVLTSERYTSKAGAMNGVESVQNNAGDTTRYVASDNGLRFNLTARNGQVIGTSETYSSEGAARAGMDAVARAAEGSTVDDQT